jgi:hypothetical protein
VHSIYQPVMIWLVKFRPEIGKIYYIEVVTGSSKYDLQKFISTNPATQFWSMKHHITWENILLLNIFTFEFLKSHH